MLCALVRQTLRRCKYSEDDVNALALTFETTVPKHVIVQRAKSNNKIINIQSYQTGRRIRVRMKDHRFCIWHFKSPDFTQFLSLGTQTQTHTP